MDKGRELNELATPEGEAAIQCDRCGGRMYIAPKQVSENGIIHYPVHCDRDKNHIGKLVLTPWAEIRVTGSATLVTKYQLPTGLRAYIQKQVLNGLEKAGVTVDEQ